ncbi:MAG TPA: GNAT family N-acetyltransferase [Trebonia sp.]|jgi:CelD/BcsL family acetyltransferase involved in cellulose biosynthesis|nr:GNAT family N-acetyltransferase [Trebonia sp.]
MRVQLIHPSELGPSEICAWRAMQRATPSLNNPFLSPDYAIAVGSFRPQSRVAVLMDGNHITGFFPFEKRRLGIGVPISGWLSPCQGVVHEAHAEWNAADLVRACGLAAWKFDNLLPDQKPFEPYHAATMPTPVIDLSRGFDAYYTGLRARASDFCRELERKARKMEREIGSLTAECDSRDRNALAALVSWKSEQYRRTAHVDRFEQPWLACLLETLLAPRGIEFTGLLSVLSAGGRPVAAQFGLRSGDLLVGWFTGYDPLCAKYSPGLIHLLRMAENLAATVNTIHMGKGALRYTRSLRNHEIIVSEGVVTAKSALGVTQHAYNLTSKQALAAARQSPRLHAGLDTILRRAGVSRRTYGRI